MGRMIWRNMGATTLAALLTAGLIATLPASGALAQYDKPEAKTDAKIDVKTDTKTEKTKKPPSPGQIAVRERQKKCAAQWKEEKAAGKIESGQSWPKYWSACNKRLKAGG
jgi:hypothetical protein